MLPKHLQEALEKGRVEHEQIKQRAAEAKAEEARQKVEALQKEYAKALEFAEKWYSEVLPVEIRVAAAKGNKTLEFDRGDARARRAVLETHGVKYFSYEKPDYDYDTGRLEGYTTVWYIGLE